MTKIEQYYWKKMYSDIVKQNIAIVYEDHLTNCDKKPFNKSNCSFAPKKPYHSNK